MATVRISTNLRETVLHNIGQMFEKRIETAEIKLKDPTFAEDILKFFIPPQVEQALRDLEAMETGKWVRMSDSFTVNTDNQYLFIRLNPAKPIPLKMTSTFHLPTDCPVYPKIKAIYDEIRAIKLEKQSLINEVEKILYASGSLAQVVAIWPSILDYVGNDIRERHNAPVVKKARREAPVIDETVQAALIKARMLVE